MDDTKVWLARLIEATNTHDVNAVVACFARDYENVTPAHPARGFVGNDQVRRNWQQIFAGVPDIRADLVAAAFDGPLAWTQWDMYGTRLDGSAHHVAGVIVFELAGALARKATFFLEPVDDSSGSADEAVREQVLR